MTGKINRRDLCPDRAIRPIRVVGDTAFIPLSQGLEAVIDAADVPLVEGRNWHAVLNRNVHYARACAPRVRGRRRMIPLHRLILSPPDEMLVDHIDGDGLNCRRSNMRLASIAENGRNKGISKANTSGYKGVSWSKSEQKWEAIIAVNRRRIRLGYFTEKEAAAACYAEASVRLHGEFALVSDATPSTVKELPHG